ncbi:unnamed protein product [Prorocentrum cordatum]|uniref:Uncharacterized protein n=1 Tax=Prorocentrum cordatum TaxID=2364126 RepID=A0ABN9Q4Z8_9DINO|nr:unnamed protein product [Polarella glacialis]
MRVSGMMPEPGGKVKALYIKHTQAVGVPAWNSDFGDLGSHLMWCIFSSDQGGDEKSAANLIAEDVAGQKNAWNTRVFCLDHIDALITGVNVQRYDVYWSLLATITNTIRSTGNGLRFKHAWRDFGPGSGMQALVRRLPPRLLKGRWSSIFACEEWFHEARLWRELPVVVKKALVEFDTHRKGKFQKATIAGLQSMKFWSSYVVSHASRWGAEHFSRWLRKKQEGGSQSGMLVELIGFKGKQIYEGIARLLDEESFVEAAGAGGAGLATGQVWLTPLEEVLSAPNLNDDGAGSLEELFCEAVSSALDQHAEFYRRVVQPCCQQYPFRLFYMVVSPADARCERRGRIAHELLTDAGIVDDTTMKFRAAFEAEMKQATADGTLCSRCWTLLADAASILKMSVRDVEGCNSILKWTGKVAPSIKLKLMSSRLTLKKTSGITGGDQSSRTARRDAKERRDQLIEDMAEGHATTMAFCKSLEDRLKGAANGSVDADSYDAIPLALAAFHSNAVEALAVEDGPVGGQSDDDALATMDMDSDAEFVAADCGGHRDDPRGGAAAGAGGSNSDRGGEDDWGDDDGLELQLHGGEMMDHAPDPRFPQNILDRCAAILLSMRKSFESTVGASFGPSSAYAVIVKHKFGEEGEDVEEWFLVSSKVGRATFWIAPLCQNFDAVNPGGLGVVRLQRPIAHRKFHWVVGHLIQQAGPRGLEVHLSFQAAQLKWDNTFQASVVDGFPLQCAKARKRLKKVDEEAVTKYLVSLDPGEREDLEAGCGGHDTSIEEVVEAAKVRMEMGGDEAEGDAVYDRPRPPRPRAAASCDDYDGDRDELLRVNRAKASARDSYNGLKSLLESLMSGGHVVPEPTNKCVSLFSVASVVAGAHATSLGWWYWEDVDLGEGRWNPGSSE